MATLFVNRKSISVSREDEHLVIKDRLVSPPMTTTLPLTSIDKVIVVGEPSITFPVLSALIDRKIPCVFLSPTGYWRGMLVYEKNVHAVRRKEQYRTAEAAPFALHLSKQIIAAKCYNSLRMIQRLARNRGCLEKIQSSHDYARMKWIGKHLQTSGSLGALRGLEGIAAMSYFNLVKSFLPLSIGFSERTRRPPKDVVNALLSWGYALLLTEVSIALFLHGLDYGMGYLHQNNNRSPALALDLMEPFRAIIDGLVVHLITHRMILPDQHFERTTNDGLHISSDGRRIFFTQYEKRMTQTFVDPIKKMQTTLRQAIKDQVNTFLHYLEQPNANVNERFFHLP